MPKPPIRSPQSLDIDETTQQALRFHQDGNLKEAERLYRAVLMLRPDHFDALHLLGVLRAQQGSPQDAVRLISHALERNPHAIEALFNLGNAQAALNRHVEAIASYDNALALKPGHAVALNNRGNALQALNRHDEALASFDKALVIKPDYAGALSNRGNALQELNRHEEALVSYDKALAINPNHANALNNRGSVLQKLNRHEEALASYDKVLVIQPDHAGALNNRGNVLQDLQRYEEALASYDRALAFRSDFAEALRGRGNALHSLRRLNEALACYERAFAISPDLEYMSGNLAWMRLLCCDWRGRNEEFGRLVSAIRAGKRSILPFMALSVTDSPQDQLLCSRIWVRNKCSTSPAPIWKGERYRHDRIRLAYLSADFRVHPMSFLIVGLFEHHDRSRFETIAISFGPDDRSEIRTRVKGAFEDFIDVRNKSDLEVARLMREREVDIAVDLMGYTQYDRMGILALRPAPVQVSYIGFPGTMGADFIDYILADRFVIPEEHHACYTEKVVYLPDTYLANDSRRVIADWTPARAEAGLPERGFVFCSFNNNYKIGPAVFDVWMRLLGNIEGSVLWLLESNAAAVRSLRQEAANRGIAPERLVFAPIVKVEEHLARHRLADLFLDTLPYNAHTTASDALWAGLPVVTCLGTTFAGRVAASLLNAIGLPELITHSLPEYEAL
ncbi:MAG TPA: tetratricopeptide repeat protein, partial [Burkholderiales bacterium]|nr:tetratricopeptide repeat protein [Burkholderiales bacterium]